MTAVPDVEPAQGNIEPEKVPPKTEDVQRKPDSENWAPNMDRLKISEVPEGASNLNLEGRQMVSPLQGFGQLWRKTYRIRLEGAEVTPQQVVASWKENFNDFQPDDNQFFSTERGVKPGEMLFIKTRLPALPNTPGVIPFSSGVMILYSDEVSFTVMTPEGFPESGWNTFSAHEEDGVTIAQVQSMARATDPVYELGFRVMGGSEKQEQTWKHVLTSLARHFGVEGPVEMTRECLDPKLQWSQAGNVWQNASIRTTVYVLSSPVRWVGRLFRRDKKDKDTTHL